MNQIKISYMLHPLAPMLIKEGKETADPSVPDMAFVRTEHYELGHTVYIPGSSTKGILRSHAEKIARAARMYVCDLFTNSCNNRQNISQDTTGKEAYKLSCIICKTFGSTQLASRIRFTDAYPSPEQLHTDQDPNRTELRCGVAIDRLLGSVAHGPFDLEVVTRGTFQGEITLRNVALWQVGLLGLTLKHLNDGMVQFGFAKSRGLGRVELKLDQIKISASIQNHVLKGIAAGSYEAIRREYGLEKIVGSDQITLSAYQEDKSWALGLWKDIWLNEDQSWEFLRLCAIGPLAQFIELNHC